MNKYRQAMIHLRTIADGSPKICTDCAGWSSFGGLDSPMYIALHGDICICTTHWTRLEKILEKDPKLWRVKLNPKTH